MLAGNDVAQAVADANASSLMTIVGTLPDGRPEPLFTWKVIGKTKGVGVYLVKK